MSDQLIAELYLTKHNIQHKHPCPRWDSNPNPSKREAIDLRLRARVPLGPANTGSYTCLNKHSIINNNNGHSYDHVPKSVETSLECKVAILLTYYTMVPSPSWEANWFAASQEIPRISRNPKVHYRTHKRPTPVSILDQPNPVHKHTSHLMEIHPYIIHPSTTRSPQWSPSLRFHHQDPIHPYREITYLLHGAESFLRS